MYLWRNYPLLGVFNCHIISIFAFISGYSDFLALFSRKMFCGFKNKSLYLQ